MSAESCDFFTNVELPLRVASCSDVKWDKTADVVVAGFGGAGVVAALEVCESGSTVIAVDRFSGGGATAFSGGVMYAGGTRFQEQAGCSDTADNMYRYLSQEEVPVERETLKKFCDDSHKDLDWIASQNVPFNSTLYPEKTTYPPEGYFLYYSGNEKVPAYKQLAAPAPRGHRARGKGFTGHVYFDALKNSAFEKGVELVPHAPVRRLVVTEEGAVIGVEVLEIPKQDWLKHQKLYDAVAPLKPFSAVKHEKAILACAALENRYIKRTLIRANKGVIICTGGFIYNRDMLKQHKPTLAKVYKSVMRLGSMGCDGSGIDLGRSIGASVSLMDSVFVGRSIVPPTSFLHGIMVDKDGRRFVNEDAYNGFLGEAIGELPNEGQAWLILDKKVFFTALKQCLLPGKGMYFYTLPSLLNILLGGTRCATSIENLAKKCGMRAEVLEASIQINNDSASSGQDPLGKMPENVRKLEHAPFFALNMDLGNKFAVSLLFTLGGLVVDEKSGLVKHQNGNSIKGLYAAGRAAVGLCSKSYLSGMSIADTVFSARRAARHASSKPINL